MLDYEDLLFSHLPHLVVQCENDLLRAETHQHCVDQICSALGLVSGPVTADLARQAIRTEVTNLADLKAALDREGLM